MNKVINSEIKKIKSFVAEQKKEIDRLQKKLETLVGKKTVRKKTGTRKKAAGQSKKQATRKTASVRKK